MVAGDLRLYRLGAVQTARINCTWWIVWVSSRFWGQSVLLAFSDQTLTGSLGCEGFLGCLISKAKAVPRRNAQ